MSLYDRDYVSQDQAYEAQSEQRSKLATFVRDTYKLLTASLIAATAGAYIGMQVAVAYNVWLFLIIEMAVLFGMNFAVSKNQNGLALMLLFAFTFITGFSIGPILNAYIAAGAGGVVTNAFLMTSVVFGSLTVYAINTKTDFSSFGKPLFFVLIAVVVFSLLNYFIFKSSMFSLIISAISSVLFSFYILFDTQNIFKGRYESPILAAVSMYLNILNLFLSLLRLLSSRD